MPARLYLNESIVRGQVRIHGWRAFLRRCLSHSWKCGLGFLVQMAVGLAALLLLGFCLWAMGFGGNQNQQKPAFNLWLFLVLLIPLLMSVGFLLKFFECRHWAFHPGEIIVYSSASSTKRINLERIRTIAIEASGDHEIWRIEIESPKEVELAVFANSHHYKTVMKSLCEEGPDCQISHIISEVG